MSLFTLALQLVCLIGAVLAEEKIVPQLTEKREYSSRLFAFLAFFLIFIDAYVKICKFKKKYYAIRFRCKIPRYVKSTITVVAGAVKKL
jgi:hypothetical protein